MDFVLSPDEREFSHEHAVVLRDECARRSFAPASPVASSRPKTTLSAPSACSTPTASPSPIGPSSGVGKPWTPVQRHLWAEELARANVPPPIVFNTSMVGPVIAEFGSRELQERFLPPTANADIWWAQGFSEPGAGSDLASLQTRAIRDGDEYVVNGQKTWTTYAQHADWIFCLVRTNPTARPQRGISFVLIELSSPGIEVRPIQLIDGEYEVNEVFFDDVRVPADQLVGEEDHGWSYAKYLLGNERTSNAGLGIIKSRIARIKRLPEDLLTDPLLQARLTTLEVETTALEMSVLRVLAGEADLPEGTPDPMSSMLKLRGTELQQDASELLVDVLGPTATHASGPERLAGASNAMTTYFNWRKASIYAGSSEIQRQIIAKTILKL